MVHALVNISEEANRVLNVIKAKKNLRTKSEAIEEMAREYEQELLEPELRPEYVERIRKIGKQKTITVKDFEKEFLS
ncbi:DUF2683 family protein [Candidatus Micrarchaeota archaeon]|nr:DUF2683 family protein [Candidatus Micrarchaeota archaeon]